MPMFLAFVSKCVTPYHLCSSPWFENQSPTPPTVVAASTPPTAMTPLLLGSGSGYLPTSIPPAAAAMPQARDGSSGISTSPQRQRWIHGGVRCIQSMEDAVETPRLERHSGHARNMLDKMPQTPGGFYLPKFSGLGLLCDIHSFSFFLLFGLAAGTGDCCCCGHGSAISQQSINFTAHLSQSARPLDHPRGMHILITL